MYCQQNFTTTGVVAFDVTTPSSVVMTAETGLSTTADNLVFMVDADSIIKMAFANGNNWRGIRIIGSGTTTLTANGALVSFSASTGFITSILPFTGTRATGSRPTVRQDGSKLIFTGQFSGAFDASGSNLAPNGASRVVLDSKAGSMTIG
jgi:hypothetical protein